MRIQLPVGLLQLNNANNNLFTTTSTNGNNHHHNFPSITTASITTQQQQQQNITDTYFYEDNPNITITSDNTVTFHKNIFNNHQLINNTTEQHCIENNRNNDIIEINNVNNFNDEIIENKNVINIAKKNDNERNYCDTIIVNETINYNIVAEKDADKVNIFINLLIILLEFYFRPIFGCKLFNSKKIIIRNP